jgi:DNA-binding transcriptional MerR regulator
MAQEIAKLLLEHANSFLARQEAIKTAIRLGMPLQEIEEYLDWLDQVRSTGTRDEGMAPPSQVDQAGP